MNPLGYRLKPVTSGVWERVEPGRYEHVAGFQVRKARAVCGPAWEIVGGPEDGHLYTTLTIAQQMAVRHLTVSARGD